MNGTGRDIMVDVPVSIFGRPRNGRDGRRHRQIQEMLLERETTMNHLFSFKIHPSKDPDLIDTRPLPRCCKTCLPEADMVIQDEVKHLGLSDCFIPPTTSSYNSTFCRTFPFYSHYSRCINVTKMHNLPSWEELESDPNLMKLFNAESVNIPSTITETKQDVLKILYQLQIANVWDLFSSLFIRFSSWLCQKYLSLHFESVLVHDGQIELLRDIHSKKLPVIYIPTYRSKFDKVLILWTLAHQGFRTPLFIRDHNVKNKYLKYFGGIGASLQVHSDPQSEKKYCSAVAVYLQHILRKGNSIMLNLESGRSRSGRPSPNVYGSELLKVIYDEYKCNNIEDAYFVPVSVSYELLPDAKEIFENVKSSPLSFLSLIKTFALGILFPNSSKGMVKIDFAQPTCFRELHNSLQKNVKIHRLVAEETDSYYRSRNCNYLRWNSTESLNSVSSLYGELAPLYPDGHDNLEEATLLDVINHHLVYDAGKCESVMPTHMLAFILMKKFRSGIYLEQLQDELRWLIKVVDDSEKDFGFFILDCDMESIAFRAVELLKDDIVCEWIEEKQTYRFAVREELASLRKLEYYANYLLPEFMMEAIIATAVFAMRGTSLTILRGFDAEIRIREDEFMFHCRRVYEVLTGSFLLHPPCLSAVSAIRKYLSYMSDRGLLILVMRDSKKYIWEDDLSDYDDIQVPVDAVEKRREIVDQDFTFVPEEVKISTLESTMDHFNFYRTLLTPYFETFAFLTAGLEILLEKDEQRMEVGALEAYLLNKLVEMSEKELHHCRELCSRYTVKQFLATCEDHSILDCDLKEGTMERYYILLKNKDALKQQFNDILFYVTI